MRVFEKGDERLDVYTANRGPLERVFGVDLIYLNTVRQNIVMVQLQNAGADNWDSDSGLDIQTGCQS